MTKYTFIVFDGAGRPTRVDGLEAASDQAAIAETLAIAAETPGAARFELWAIGRRIAGGPANPAAGARVVPFRRPSTEK